MPAVSEFPDHNIDIETPPPRRSLTIPLTIILTLVLSITSYYYLRTTYPNLFINTSKRLTDLLTNLSQRAARDDAGLEPEPLPTHSPYPLIPDNGSAGTFKASHQTDTGPKITKIIIDPLAAQQGDTVTVSLVLTHPQKIAKVTAAVNTDNDTASFTLKPTSQTGDQEVWTGQVTLADTFDYKYIYNFTATDGANTSQLPMALRN